MLKNKNVTLAIIIKFYKLSHCFQGVLSVTNAKGHLKGILKLPVAWKNVSIWLHVNGDGKAWGQLN